MAIVRLTNLSSGMRAFHNIHRQAITLKPGEDRQIELAPSHVAMIEREMKKPTSTVSLAMSAEERELHDADMAEISKANRIARAGASVRTLGRSIAPSVRMPKIDRRFITDPKPELNSGPEAPEAPEAVDPKTNLDAEAEAEAVRKVVEGAEPSKTKAKDDKKKKPKVERVLLKTKKKE